MVDFFKGISGGGGGEGGGEGGVRGEGMMLNEECEGMLVRLGDEKRGKM